MPNMFLSYSLNLPEPIQETEPPPVRSHMYKPIPAIWRRSCDVMQGDSGETSG